MPAALQLPHSLVVLTLDQGPQRWDQGSPPPLQLQGMTRLTTLTLRNFRCGSFEYVAKANDCTGYSHDDRNTKYARSLAAVRRFAVARSS